MAVAVVDEEEQVRTMQVDEPASAQLPTKDTVHGAVEEALSETMPSEATTHTDIPIDPALLGGDDLLRLAHVQGHSLIAMVCTFYLEYLHLVLC